MDAVVKDRPSVEAIEARDALIVAVSAPEGSPLAMHVIACSCAEGDQ